MIRVITLTCSVSNCLNPPTCEVFNNKTREGLFCNWHAEGKVAELAALGRYADRKDRAPE